MENISIALYTYFKGLEKGDTHMVLDVFAENALIHSPLYGDVYARDFYTESSAGMLQSDIALLNIFESKEQVNTAAVHFKYHMVLQDGTPAHFECVDIFKFDEAGKIADMTIIYDTAKLRTAFEKLI